LEFRAELRSADDEMMAVHILRVLLRIYGRLYDAIERVNDIVSAFFVTAGAFGSLTFTQKR